MLPIVLQPGHSFPHMGRLVEQVEDFTLRSSVSCSATAVCQLCCPNRGGWHPCTQSPRSFHLWAQEKKNQKKIKKQQKKGISKYIRDLQPRRLYALPLSALWSKNNGQWKWLAAKLKQYIKRSKSLSITCWLYCMGNQWDTQFSGIRKGNRMFT